MRGNNAIAWRESDVGSGLRFSRLKVDGATLSDGTIDYQANGGCRTGHSDANGEFARDFTPCTQGPYVRYYGLRTEELSDGQHQLSTCVQDFAQYQHLGESASESCDTRTIHVDNSAPGKPAELKVTSANPERYLDHFGASFSLPPDPGSPIAKVHYEVLGAKGEVLVPEKTVSATNPTSLANVEGPKTPGAYTLRVWLEDSVGFVGPAADAPIPHDTTPPAAPQELHAAGRARALGRQARPALAGRGRRRLADRRRALPAARRLGRSPRRHACRRRGRRAGDRRVADARAALRLLGPRLAL